MTSTWPPVPRIKTKDALVSRVPSYLPLSKESTLSKESKTNNKKKGTKSSFFREEEGGPWAGNKVGRHWDSIVTSLVIMKLKGISVRN